MYNMGTGFTSFHPKILELFGRTGFKPGGRSRSVSSSQVDFPSIQTLAHTFGVIFNDQNCGSQVSILARERNYRKSAYPSEIVTCRFADGGELRVLCKYAGEVDHIAYGHRGGICYEAQVYRELLRSLPVSTPRFYGFHKDICAGVSLFMIEYLDESQRVIESRDPALMKAAARWLGQFHRSNELRFSAAAMPFLRRHHAEYYLGWVRRTAVFTACFHERFPWLSTLCKRFEEIVDVLLEPPSIVIHGEYYPRNILFKAGVIYPVDWESTAAGMAEIDLASLIEGWHEKMVETCKNEYKEVRWPEGSPADFERRLAYVEFYWLFRWLGDRPGIVHYRKTPKRIARLRSLGERFGLI